MRKLPLLARRRQKLWLPTPYGHYTGAMCARRAVRLAKRTGTGTTAGIASVNIPGHRNPIDLPVATVASSGEMPSSGGRSGARITGCSGATTAAVGSGLARALGVICLMVMLLRPFLCLTCCLKLRGKHTHTRGAECHLGCGAAPCCVSRACTRIRDFMTLFVTIQARA